MTSNTRIDKIAGSASIFSIRETADFFSVHCRTINRLIRAGKLPAWQDEEGELCVARIDLKKFCSKNSCL